MLSGAEIDFWRMSTNRSRLEENRNTENRGIMKVEETITEIIEKR